MSINKKAYIGIISTLLFILPIHTFGDGAEEALTGADIMEKVTELTSIDNSIVHLDMRVFRNKKMNKHYKMILSYLNSDHSKSETIYPPRSKGEVMLHSEDNDWLFLPRINRVIRVSIGDTFSNSDFSNLDVMETDFTKDYTAKLIGEEILDGKDFHIVELSAKTDKETYAKIEMWVQKDYWFVSKRKYYTYSGHLIKEMALFDKNGLANGMPDTFIMTSTLEKDKFTILSYTAIERNIEFSENTFSKSSLIKQ